jgi:ubiquinone/menaquinone biosynthesis C-methylase UbiE
MSEPTAYVFDETTHDTEFERLSLLEGIFDGATKRALVAAGIAPGWRCLEVGAGAGSIAAWMGDVVGPAGRVAAVDINTRFLSPLRGDNIEVHQADIRSVLLEPASFDMAHARFVLIHLADWRSALGSILALLKPGGRVVLEEPDFSSSRALAGATIARQSFDAVHRAIEAMFTARGMDFAFGARLPTILQGYGLDDLALENDAPVVPGGSAFAKMMEMSTRQLQAKYLATGLATAEQIAGYGAFTADPGCWATYHATIRAAARRPRNALSVPRASAR